MSREPGLALTPLLRSDHTAQIRLDGELTYDTVDAARIQLHALIDAGCRHLILEVSGVDWSDSVGLGLLIGLRNAVDALGGQFAVRGARGQLARVLEITGTAELLTESGPRQPGPERTAKSAADPRAARSAGR